MHYIYKKTHTDYFLQKGTTFLNLSPAPQPLGLITCAMTTTATVTAMPIHPLCQHRLHLCLAQA